MQLRKGCTLHAAALWSTFRTTRGLQHIGHARQIVILGCTAEGEAAELATLSRRAPALVRSVAPANLGAFAALFTAALLQAASTGEALLDEELGSLAARDPGRFSRLNLRMQARAL